jgi:hypothetical protein
LGSITINGARRAQEINSRFAMAKVAFNRKKILSPENWP